jgi:hypothetical protein
MAGSELRGDRWRSTEIDAKPAPVPAALPAPGTGHEPRGGGDEGIESSRRVGGSLGAPLRATRAFPGRARPRTIQRTVTVRPTRRPGIVPVAMRTLVAALVLSTASLVGAQVSGPI